MSRSILCAVALALCCGASYADQVLLTYDLRIADVQNLGVAKVNDHTATVTAAGNVVNLELYAVIHNGNGDQTDDGFLTGQGSFVSSPSGILPKLQGTLRGGGTPTSPSLINNVAPFKATGATSGAPSDYEGDGVIDDVGKNTTSFGELNDFFLAFSGPTSVNGVSAVAGDVSEIIGKTTFTVGSALLGLAAKVDFIPRLRTDGPPSLQNVHYFSSDVPRDSESGEPGDYNYALRGDDPRISNTGSLIIGAPVPEPNSWLLIVLGGLGLVTCKARVTLANKFLTSESENR